jgi:hypothetical protein
MVAPYLIERQGRLMFGGAARVFGRRMARHQVIVDLIWASTTHSGLWVRAALDLGRSQLRIRVGFQELATLHSVA